MIPFHLNDFNSFFELLVAFAFAYAGVKTFRDFINDFSVKTSTGKMETFAKSVQRSEEIYGSISIVTQQSAERIKSAISDKLDKLKLQHQKISGINAIALEIYNGNRFESMFFLVGFVYILFILVGTLQNSFGNIFIFIFVTVISIAMYIFYGISYWQMDRLSRQKMFVDKDRCKNSRFMIKWFLLGAVLCFGISCKAAPIFNQYVYPLHYDLISFLKGNAGHYIYIFEALLLAIIPYGIYVKREQLLLKRIMNTFKKEEIIFDDLNKDISDLWYSCQNHVLIMP